MNSLYRKFYRSFYLHSGGYMPTKPLNQNVYPGDFFQIINGTMVVLGNIFRKSIISPENQQLLYGIKLNASNWHFSEGVSKPYAGRGSGNNPIEGKFEYSKQILAFNEIGSCFFHGNNPEAFKIGNWSAIEDELIIKLTQTLYSFREVYVITECASTSDWTLAISSTNEGELEIATESENFGLVDIFGHNAAKTIQSKDIEYYNRETNRKPSFFKAKHLVVQNAKNEVFINTLLGDRNSLSSWASEFFEGDHYHGGETHIPASINGTEGGVLDMLQANELNPNTALDYFRWEDANLDTIEKLFIAYGS